MLLVGTGYTYLQEYLPHVAQAAVRNGIISGCYPLDPYYKDLPEHAELKERKAAMRKALTVRPA
jgi:NADPH2 dehydrogenase